MTLLSGLPRLSERAWRGTRAESSSGEDKPMKRLIMWAAIALIVVAVGVGVYWAYWLWPAPEHGGLGQARLVDVGYGPVTVEVEAVGRVRAEQEMTLSFGAGGVVTEVLARENATVQAGETLVRMDTSEAELALERARAALAVAQAEAFLVQRGPTDAELAAAEAALMSAKATYEDVSAGPSSAAYASAMASLRSAETSYSELVKGPEDDELKVLEANLARTKVALDAAQGDYDRFAWREGFDASPQAAALQIATIDYEQALAQYNLASADASPERLDAAKARIAEAEARVDALQSGLDAQVSSAAAQVARAESELAALRDLPSEQSVAIAAARVAQAQTSVAEAERQIALCEMVSPVRGRIVGVRANRGMVAAPGSPAVVLLPDEPLRVDLLINEADIVRVSVGDGARVLSDTSKETLAWGEITAVGLVPRMVYGTSNYSVQVTLSSVAEGVLPGMAVRVLIDTGEIERAVRLDRGDLMWRSGAWQALRVEAGVAQAIAVEVGPAIGGDLVVLSGLGDGDRLLTRPGDLAVGSGLLELGSVAQGGAQ